jgi:hypothetical protein
VLSLDAYEEMLQIPNCVGAKHSSLSRRLESDREIIRTILERIDLALRAAP